MKKRSALTLFCTVFFLLPFLCACGRNSALEDGFLPVSVGIDRAADGYDFCFGGYEPGRDGEALYADRTVRTASVTAAFDEIDLSYGMLASLVVSPSTAKDGLYPLYAAFIYNDDATEAMALAMSPNPEALLCRTDQDGEDVNAFLRKEQLSCPSVLSYDIAMRTPGETCLVPMIARTDGGQIELLSAAVFSEDKLCGQIPAELLPYAQLLSGQRRQMLIDFDVPGLDSGSVRVLLSCDRTLLNDREPYRFRAVVFGSGLVAARMSTHESLLSPSDSQQIAESINAAIEQNCLAVTALAQQTLRADPFGFSRMILARSRGASTRIKEIFCQSEIDVQSRVEIQNLTQIH